MFGQKFDQFQTLRNGMQKSVQTDTTCNTQQCCVRFYGAIRKLLSIVEFVRIVNILFIIVTSAKVESANWAPEVAFSPFRALCSRQLTFPFCCFQLNHPNYIDRDDVIGTTTAPHDFSFLFQVRFLQFK